MGVIGGGGESAWIRGLRATADADRKAFFAVNQSRPPVIVRLDLPLGDPGGGKARIAEVIDLRDVVTEEASDITIDPDTGHFLAW